MTPVLKLEDHLRPGEVFHLQNDIRRGQWGVSYHTHRFAELFWIFQGSGRHHVNGKTVDLVAGDIVFIRPADAHSLETLPPDPMGLVNIAFFSHQLTAIRQRYFCGNPEWPWTKGRLPQVHRLETARLFKLQEWIDGLAFGRRSQLELDRFLLNLLHLVVVNVEEEPLPGEIPDWLARACKGIRERDAMQEGVKAWVRLCRRSPEHVARITRAWLGMSPTEYVNRVRLTSIERQLRETSIPIIDLSMDAGFSSLGHMYELFKARYGLPPRRYRQRHRKILV